MKNLMMLAVLVLGTTAMVNAQTTPAKAENKMEVKHVRKAKHVKHAKKAEATKTEATKAEAKK